MHLLDLTLPSPQENLAADEALLDWCDSNDGPQTLRFWMPGRYFVVLGYANRAAQEARLDLCRKAGVPVLRRCSGGGTVLQGPGLLNYSLVLRVNDSGPLATITGANRFIMERQRHALTPLLGETCRVEGHTDLTLDGIKFSGNAQRRKRRFLLFHGTFLLRFDLAQVERFLPYPSKAPDYRAHRSHLDFLTNLNLPAKTMRNALQREWQALQPLKDFPSALCQQLLRERYSQAEWHLKF